jgi:C4-dicarboxylate-specific signal transduction histidine kinase
VQKLEAIGRLTGGVAHDFNNLLMAISGSIELARKRVVGDPKVEGLLNNAMLGAQRGISLTKRMLAFARRQHLEPRAVDIPALVEGMQEMLDRSLGPSIEIRFINTPDCSMAMVDPHQLELALLNLAVNGRDAMPNGGTLTIFVRNDILLTGPTAGQKSVVLSVADDGEGMDSRTLERAAEPFFTTKGVGKGTGLGLSMVQGMVEQSGGRLVLKSEKGVGTTAEIWLPTAESAKGPEQDVSEVEKAWSSAKSVVLAVDDDSLVLMNTVAMLEELGHRVYSATSGKSALELIAAHSEIDVVITDQAMPNMTGLQLCAALAEVRPGLPVIIATGYAELPSDSASSFAKLNKPFDLEELDYAMTKIRPAGDASA